MKVTVKVVVMATDEIIACGHVRDSSPAHCCQKGSHSTLRVQTALVDRCSGKLISSSMNIGAIIATLGVVAWSV